jgi:hypothetical protein
VRVRGIDAEAIVEKPLTLPFPTRGEGFQTARRRERKRLSVALRVRVR